MRPFQIALTTLVATCLAEEVEGPQWTIDKGCDTFKGQDGKVVQIRDNIKDAVLEGITLAQNAHSVMKDHAKDEWVQTMSKLVLGNKDFEARFDAAKVTFQKVAAFRRSPSKFQPITAGSGVAATKMSSLNSNILNRAGFNQAKDAGLNPKAEDYTKETQFASSTDVCTWFISKAVNDGWRKVDEDSVKKVMSDDFRTGLGGAPPVDGLKTIGFTFLHEATHTNQGGLLVDVIIPASLKQRIPSCYNWRCVVAMAKELEIKAERNADSIAMLALLLKLW
ncbi:hypothetical protein LY78DRAFT_73628 [Colletotrichum sublineola]|nr:hypothetical protein LY78DRAFT_73628 [Colletotrichum sublineola]